MGLMARRRKQPADEPLTRDDLQAMRDAIDDAMRALPDDSPRHWLAPGGLRIVHHGRRARVRQWYIPTSDFADCWGDE